MNDIDKERFQTALCSLWQTINPTGGPLPIETQRAYYVALSDLTIEQVESAALESMRSCKWFPKPVELRNMIELDNDSKALRAWSVATSALGESLSNVFNIDFSDPLINATVRTLGGLSRIKDMLRSDYLTWYRKEFLATYSVFLKDAPALRSCRAIVDDSTRETIRVPCSYITGNAFLIEAETPRIAEAISLAGHLTVNGDV